MTPTPLIVFTGHRDRRACQCDLRAIASEYGSAEWVHGGAIGFDTQVDRLARAWGIPVQVVRPDYRTHSPQSAPLIRNDQMLKMAGVVLVVACWDGRASGGTYYMIRSAEAVGLPVLKISPYPRPHAGGWMAAGEFESDMGKVFGAEE